MSGRIRPLKLQTSAFLGGGLESQSVLNERTFRATADLIWGLCYLEEVDVSIGIAEAEHVLLLGVLGNGLDDAVLGQEGVAGGQLHFWGASAVGLIEEQRAPCRDEQIQE